MAAAMPRYEYDHDGKHIHVFATYAEYSQLADAVQAMSPLIAEVPADHDVVLDFYTWHSGALDDAESKQQRDSQDF